MRGPQRIEIGRQHLVRRSHGELRLRSRRTAGTAQPIEIVGRGRDADHRFVRPGDGQPPAVRNDRTALRANGRLRAEPHAVDPFAAARQHTAHHDPAPFARDRRPFGTRQAHGEMQGARLRSAQPHEHRILRARNEIFALVVHAARIEPRIGRRIVQPQAPLVARDGAAVEPVIQRQQTQHLVTAVGRLRRTAAAADETPVHQLLRLEIAAFEQQLPDARQSRQGIGIGGRLLATAPHRDVVQHEGLAHDAAVGHGAQAAVAERKRLLPAGGRFVVPQQQGATAGGIRSAAAAQQRAARDREE